MENIYSHNNNSHNHTRLLEAAADDNPTTSAAGEIREQDRLLPIANVGRIMRDVLPPNAKVSKEAKETMQECVSEFVAFVTAEASDKCRRERRKTVNGDDVCWALAALGFDSYAAAMKRFLMRFRDFEEGNRISATATVTATTHIASGDNDCKQGFSNGTNGDGSDFRDRKAGDVAAGCVSEDKGTDGRGVEEEVVEVLMAGRMQRNSTVRIVDGGGGGARFLSFYGQQEDRGRAEGQRVTEEGGTYGDGYHLLHHHQAGGSSSSQPSGDLLRYFSTDESGR